VRTLKETDFTVESLPSQTEVWSEIYFLVYIYTTIWLFLVTGGNLLELRVQKRPSHSLKKETKFIWPVAQNRALAGELKLASGSSLWGSSSLIFKTSNRLNRPVKEFSRHEKPPRSRQQRRYHWRVPEPSQKETGVKYIQIISGISCSQNSHPILEASQTIRVVSVSSHAHYVKDISFPREYLNVHDERQDRVTRYGV
jgi:hypothetical protein